MPSSLVAPSAAREFGSASRVSGAVPVAPLSGAELAGCVVRWQGVGPGRIPRLADLGLGVVPDEPDARDPGPGRIQVYDLVSRQWRIADVSGPVSVLGRVPSAVLRRLLSEEPPRAPSPDVDPPGALAQVASILSGLGFGDASRPILLRMAFRDVVRDLDLHDLLAVRLGLPEGGVARVTLGEGRVELVVETSASPGAPGLVALDRELALAFPGRPILPGWTGADRATAERRIRLEEPGSLDELAHLMDVVRGGLLAIMAAFEPRRHSACIEHLGAFGPRDSLALLRGDVRSTERVH